MLGSLGAIAHLVRPHVKDAARAIDCTASCCVDIVGKLALLIYTPIQLP